MRRALVACALFACALVACARASAPPDVDVARAERTESSVPRDDALLARPAVTIVDGARLRAHPIGARLGPLFEVLQGAAAIHARGRGAIDVVRDGDVLVVRASSFRALADGAVTLRLAPSAARTPAFGADVHAGAAPPLGVVRISEDEVLAPGRRDEPTYPVPGRAAIDGARGRHAVALFLDARATQDGLAGDSLWSGTRSLVFTVTGGDASAADARLDVRADDPEAARAFAERLRARVERIDRLPLVRTVTRGLLTGVRVAVDADDPSRVVAELHATADQLTAVLDLAAAATGTPLPRLSSP